MNSNHQVSTLSKIGYGILLPDTVFVVYQYILIKSTSGTGSWDGMTIFFGTLFIVPGLLVANCWVIPIQWRRKITVCLAGVMIPVIIGVVEFLWLYGSDKTRHAISSVKNAPSNEIWIVIFSLFIPLLVSIVLAVRRRFHADQA